MKWIERDRDGDVDDGAGIESDRNTVFCSPGHTSFFRRL